jgi:ParB-like nuclease domain
MSTLASIGRLILTYLALNLLVPGPCNPRKHSPRQIRQIARSVKTFGFAVPILVDRNNTIVAGHGRYFAAQSLGLTEVPVIRLEHLTDAQAKAFRIADNRLTEISSWDDRLLAECLKELSELDLDFGLEAIGFEMGEIDFRIESLTFNEADRDEADVIPSREGQPAVTKRGDLWLLGRHRVCCDNALEQHAFDTLMQGHRAGMVFVDPPYNVGIDGHASGLGRIHHREFAMASGEMNVAQFTSFLAKALTLLSGNSDDGAIPIRQAGRCEHRAGGCASSRSPASRPRVRGRQHLPK